MNKNSSLVYPWVAQDEKRHILYQFKNDNILRTSAGELSDLSSLSFHCSFGFNNKVIAKQIEKQASKSLLSVSKFEQPIQTDCSAKLLELLNLKGHIFFTLSGSESIEHGLKICRQYTKRDIILSRRKSYHGATQGALQITGDWRRNIHFLPTTGHEWIPEPEDDPDFSKTFQIIKNLGPEKIAGICLESITAKNGVYILPLGWIKGLKKVQKEFGIKLIFDEVVCGFYRTGKPFGFQHYPLKPDIVCMGKAISNGMAPLGAVFFSVEIINSFKNTPFLSGLTNYAHPLSLSAFVGVLNFTSSKIFKKRYNENQKIILNWLKSEKSNINTFRGKGFLFGIDLKNKIELSELKKLKINIVVNEKTLIFCPIISLPKKTLISDLKRLSKFIEGNK